MIFRFIQKYHIWRKLLATTKHNRILPIQKYTDEESEIILEVFYNKAYALGFPESGKRVVVDIGAHRGFFSLWARQTLGEGAEIYSYEPENQNYKRLIQNLKNHNCHTFNAGVAGETGQRNLSLRSSVNHTILSDSGEKGQTINVLSLQDILTAIDNEIDYCKIDCEGAEYEAFASCPKEVVRKVKVFTIEAHWVDNGSQSMITLIDQFQKFGYRVLGTAITPTALPMVEGIGTFIRDESYI